MVQGFIFERSGLSQEVTIPASALQEHVKVDANAIQKAIIDGDTATVDAMVWCCSTGKS